MKLLVSVRDETEALLAAEAGADLIDLKEPRAGALGALPMQRIAQVVRALRAGGHTTRISATVGDAWPGADAAAIEQVLARVRATAACGVDDVKVGVGPGDAPLLARLAELAAAALPGGACVVPVLIVDAGPADALPWALVAAAGRAPFPALMLDTADKSRGSLLERLPRACLQGFIDAARAGGRSAGLAGSLRLADLPLLHALAPDFAGFRGAVCAGDRRAALDAARLRALRASVPLALVGA